MDDDGRGLGRTGAMGIMERLRRYGGGKVHSDTQSGKMMDGNVGWRVRDDESKDAKMMMWIGWCG